MCIRDRDITLDPLGFPYLGMTTGLVHVDADTNFRHWTSANSLLLNNIVDDVYVETDGTVWASTPWGVMERSETDSTFHHFNNSGLPGNGVRTVTQDPGGSFWFATPNGLAKFNAGPILESEFSSDKTTLNFGTVPKGTSKRDTVTITNTGDATLIGFSEILYSGFDFYIISGGGTFNLLPGQSQQIIVSFSPQLYQNPSDSYNDYLICAHNAASSPDTIRLTAFGPDPYPLLLINPDTLDFGTVYIGNEDSLAATLTNSGFGDLEIYQEIITGPDSADFGTYSMTAPSPWTPGNSGSIEITFRPTTPGSKQAYYVFDSSAPFGPDTLVVQGIAQFIAPEFSSNKTALAYGEISVGATVPDTVTITNTGTDTLKLEDPEIFGAGANRFAIASGGGAVNLLPNQSRQLIVNFTPAGEQDYAASLVFFHNADTSPDTIALSGTGIFAFPELTKSTSTIDFGAVSINVGISVPVRLESTGNLAVENIAVTLVQGTDNVYSVSVVPETLDPDTFVNLDVSFTPRAAVTYPGLVVITSNAPSSPDSIAITGRGRMVELTLDPYSLVFGDVQVDSSATRSFWMKNNSFSPIQITRSYFRPLLDNAVYTVVGDVPGSLPALDSALITLRFRPLRNETYGASFIIESSANSSPDSVYLSGTGQSFNFEFPEPPAPSAGEGDQSLSFTVDPPIPGATVWVHYIQAGSTVWDSIACEYESPNYTVILPEEILNLRGLVYYMSVEDSTGATIYQNGSPDEPAAFIPVIVEEQVSDVEPEEEVYTLISVPCTLEDDRIMEVLRDDLGVQSAKSWRMFYWNPVDSVYDEFDPVRDALDWRFTPGIAYWLITRTGSTLTIEDGQSTNGLTPFSITLWPGWNQIGNPFAFAVRWSNVINAAGLQLVGRNSAGYTYDDTTLEPWTGYFVYNPYGELWTIEVPPVEAATATPKAMDEPLADGEFAIRINALGLDSEYMDDQNFLGMKTDAENGRDVNDLYEAPPIGDPLSLSILENGISYAGNFKQANTQGAFWDLALSVADKAETVRLSLEWTGQIPENFDVWLLDKDRECLIPVRDNVAEIAAKGSNAVQSLRLIAGTESFAEESSDNIPLVPYSFALMQNYPNPFNPETQIPYHLKEKSNVRLAIYNVRGQRVRTLVQGVETTGAHQVTWDSRSDYGIPVPSGIYIVRLETERFSDSKKMILVR